MAFVKKIDIPSVEALTRELIDFGSKIRELQDSLELQLIEQKKNLTDYKAGSIQKTTFKDVNAKYESEKAATIAKLTQNVKAGVAVISKMQGIVKAFKV